MGILWARNLIQRTHFHHAGRLLCRHLVPFSCHPTSTQPISTHPPTINLHSDNIEAFRLLDGHPVGAKPDPTDAFPSCWKIVVSPGHSISMPFNIYPADFHQSTNNKPSFG